MTRDKNKSGVLFFFHYTEMNNGAVRSMVDVIERLRKVYNQNIAVVYPNERGSAIDYLEELGVHCYKVRYGRLDFPLNSGFVQACIGVCKQFVKALLSIVEFRKIKPIIQQENIGVIYTNTAVLYIGALVSAVYKLPHIWHIREFGKEDHGIGFMLGKKNLYKMINRTADVVVCISNSIKSQYSSHIRCKSVVVYNDISPAFINGRKRYFSDRNMIRAVIIGSIQEGKGQLEAIQAVEIANNKGCKVTLHIGGNTVGRYYEKIKQYISDHELDKFVVFDGFISNTNEYRRKMDIGIVASSNEAFGRVTIEGMLSGLLMIGADAAGTKELICDRENGLLYNLHDPEDLADKLCWIAENQDIAIQMASCGYEKSIKRYTTGKAADEIYNIIERLNAERRLK